MAPGRTMFDNMQPAFVPDILTVSTNTFGTNSELCTYETVYPSASGDVMNKVPSSGKKCTPPTFDLTIDTSVKTEAEDIITPRLSRMSLNRFDVDNILQEIMAGDELVDLTFDDLPTDASQSHSILPQRPALASGSQFTKKVEPSTRCSAVTAVSANNNHPKDHIVDQLRKDLPKGHKPARGRGRTKQLKQMTDAQKQAENAILKERNRRAARDFRARRKNKMQALNESLEHFRALSETQAVEITTLKQEVARLKALAGTCS